MCGEVSVGAMDERAGPSNPEVPGSSPGRDGHLAGTSFILYAVMLG